MKVAQFRRVLSMEEVFEISLIDENEGRNTDCGERSISGAIEGPPEDDEDDDSDEVEAHYCVTISPTSTTADVDDDVDEDTTLTNIRVEKIEPIPPPPPKLEKQTLDNCKFEETKSKAGVEKAKEKEGAKVEDEQLISTSTNSDLSSGSLTDGEEDPELKGGDDDDDDHDDSLYIVEDDDDEDSDYERIAKPKHKRGRKKKSDEKEATSIRTRTRAGKAALEAATATKKGNPSSPRPSTSSSHSLPRLLNMKKPVNILPKVNVLPGTASAKAFHKLKRGYDGTIDPWCSKKKRATLMLPDGGTKDVSR